MLRIGGHVILSKVEFEQMKEALARCQAACPLLTRLKELEPGRVVIDDKQNSNGVEASKGDPKSV